MATSDARSSKAASAGMLCAGAAAALGCVVLAGWALDVSRLTTFADSLEQMKANTALGFLLAGVALALAHSGHWRMLVRILATLVALIALISLVEYVAGRNLGIDELLVDDPEHRGAPGAPGRMGPNTAFAFALVAISLLANGSDRGARFGQSAAVAALVVAFVAVLGYVFGVPRLHSGLVEENLTPMALQTALGLGCLAVSLLLVRTDVGLTRLAASRGTGGVLLRRLFVPAVAAPVVLGYLRLLGQEAGLYGTRQGIALFAAALIVLYAALLVHTARALERADAEHADLEERLRQSQKMEAVGRLAGGIAHDFNNLLTVISGYGELLLGRLEADDPRRAEAEQITAAAGKAATLTRQLLAFSRRQVLEPRVLDLNEEVERIAPMLRRVTSETVDVRTSLQPDLGAVEVDPSQVDQVLLNLVVNAQDAMPHGGTLTLETQDWTIGKGYFDAHAEAPVEPGAYVMLAVADTGVGMDEVTRKRIFEPFFTTKEVGEGTGLGLATVYGIVRQSGGWLSVYSELGCGTTFRIYLPRVTSGETALGLPQEPAAPLPRGQDETVLVVEDDPSVREFARRALQASDYTVLVAANGAEAIDICNRHDEVALVLSDVVMPGVGGLELVGRLRSARPALRILCMSGYSREVAQAGARLGPEVGFIQKPFSASDLVLKVHEMLSDSHPQEGAA